MQHRGWGDFRGLQHNGTTCRQSGPQLCRGQEHLCIPGDDGRDDADGRALGIDMHIRLFDGQNRAFDLVGQSCKVTIIIGDIAGLPDGFRRQLPAVGGLQPAQFFCILFNQIG